MAVGRGGGTMTTNGILARKLAPVTPELESTALLYTRDLLVSTERLERRVQELERELAAARDARICRHAAELAELRAEAAKPPRIVYVERPEQDPNLIPLSPSCTFDVAARRLVTETARVRLGPVEARILLTLARRPRQVVPCADLLADVWPGRDVGWNTLRTKVSLVRGKLRQAGGVALLNVLGEGYQLVPVS